MLRGIKYSPRPFPNKNGPEKMVISPGGTRMYDAKSEAESEVHSGE